MQRKINFIPNFTDYAEASVLIETGKTKVICNISIEKGVPSFLRDSGKGWLTAEYGMLPRSTQTRMKREVSSGKISGRTAEIQRLIGRSLRAVTDLYALDGYTVNIDCDVIQADGGTRTASISGAALALKIAFEKFVRAGFFTTNPMKELIAAVSVGIINDCENRKIIVNLDYINDSQALVDMNVVMAESGKLIEIQGTGEESTFSRTELNSLLDEAEIAIKNIILKQKEILDNYCYQED